MFALLKQCRGRAGQRVVIGSMDIGSIGNIGSMIGSKELGKVVIGSMIGSKELGDRKVAAVTAMAGPRTQLRLLAWLHLLAWLSHLVGPRTSVPLSARTDCRWMKHVGTRTMRVVGCVPSLTRATARRSRI